MRSTLTSNGEKFLPHLDSCHKINHFTLFSPLNEPSLKSKTNDRYLPSNCNIQRHRRNSLKTSVNHV